MRYGFIGLGNMASAIIAGMAACGKFKNDYLYGYNRSEAKTLALKEKARKAQEARERAEAEEAAAKLKDVIVTVRAKAGANGRLFGSVTSQEIVDALREQHGVSIEKNRIVQAEPIKSFGSFEVKCKFGYGIDGTVQLLVIEK